MKSLKQAVKRRLLNLLHVHKDEHVDFDEHIGSELIDGRGHREYVGGHWEAIGRLQFQFMIEQGLQPQHVLLDVACGSLRAGVRFIPYLETGHYLGLDINQQLVDIGIEHELGQRLYALKKPELVISDSFEFSRFSKQPDFAIAQSLFTHLIEPEILLCLRNFRKVAKPNVRFYVTFFESDRPFKNPERSDTHVGFCYTLDQMTKMADASGWAVRYIGDWKHPRGQKMLEYTIKS
jgi:ubiquinone/menaquinone biosynthesis C-methylase UbiE